MCRVLCWGFLTNSLIFFLAPGNKGGPAVSPHHLRGTRAGSTPPCPRSYRATEGQKQGLSLGLATPAHHGLFLFPEVDASLRSSETQCFLLALPPVSAVRGKSPVGTHWSCWLRFCHWATSWAEPKGLFPPHPAWRSPPLCLLAAIRGLWRCGRSAHLWVPHSW